MTSTEQIDHVNKKLIEQILKLRQAKAEIQQTFTDLDELLLDTSNLTRSSAPRSRAAYLDDEALLSSSSLASSSDDDFAVKLTYPSGLDATSDIESDDDALSTTSDDSDMTTTTTTSSQAHRHTKPSKKHKHKPPPPQARSPANIQFTYKFPVNTLPPRAPTSYSEPFYHVGKSRRNFVDDSESDWSSGARRPRPPSKPYVRPAWVPNGKIQPPYKPTLSSSMSCLNDQRKRDNTLASSNPKFSTPWRHTGKIKPNLSSVYLSSGDLTRSLDRTSFKKEKSKPLDIGPGWKTTLHSNKPDFSVYSRRKDEEIDPIKKVVVKRKIIVDDKDVGGGWKTTLGKPKVDTSMFARVAPTDGDDSRLAKKRTTVVKRKVIVDEKDVGKGWKPVKIRSNEDLKIYESPVPAGAPPPSSKNTEKKKLVDEKDVGKGWKPSGRVTYDEYPKAMTSSELKKSVVSESDAAASKPPLPRDVAKAKPKFVPTGKTRTLSPPGGKSVATSKKNGKPAAALQENPKPKSNMITSTPNMSKDFEDENPLEASIIEKTVEEDEKKPEIVRKAPREEEPDLNKKIQDEGEVNEEEKEKPQSPKEVEPSAAPKGEENKETLKTDEEKKEEATKPETEKAKVEEPKTPAGNEEEEKEVNDDDVTEEPKDFIFRKFFDIKPTSKDDQEEAKTNGEPSERSQGPSEGATEASGATKEDEKGSKNDSVFKVVDDDDDAAPVSKKSEKDAANKDEKDTKKTPSDPKTPEAEKEDSQLWNLRDSDDE